MAKYSYPAVFCKDGSMYTVRFPDLAHCYTQGRSAIEAVEMAEDVLGMTLHGLEEKGLPIPLLSDPRTLEAGENGFVSLVVCDTQEYQI